MAKQEFKLKLNPYEIEWVEDAIERERNGYSLDEGTLKTLAQLLMDRIEL